jgi:hypothetical protein
MDSDGSLFSAELVSQNVLKSPGKEVATGSAVTLGPNVVGSVLCPRFDPAAIRIDQAAGGFSTLVEISARHCLKVFDLALYLPYSIPLNVEAINQLINEPHDLFATALLNQPAGTNLSLYDFFVSEFTPISLTFKEAHELVIAYEANVGYAIRRVEPPTLYPYLPIPGFIGDPIGPISEFGNVSAHGAYGTPRTYQAPSARLLMSNVRTQAACLQEPASVRSLALSDTWNAGSDTLGTVLGSPIPGVGVPTQGMIGRLRIEITCPYTYDVDDDLRRVDVYAVLTHGALNVLNADDDVARLYQAGAFGADGALLRDVFIQKKRVHITPTIAVAGRSSAALPPDEFQNFDAVAFHVTAKPSNLQAMTVAINLKPGCLGIIEDVPHFIGSNDFGVITDEFHTERLFRYRWRTGGFFRQFPLWQTTQVQRNSHVEDATLYGHLSLDTLDVISFEIEANTNADTVKVGGSASVYTEYLQLSDGTKIYQPDAQHANFGDPKVLPWTFMTEIKVNPVLPSEPLLRQFQQHAYSDAFHARRVCRGIHLKEGVIHGTEKQGERSLPSDDVGCRRGKPAAPLRRSRCRASDPLS